MELFIPSLVVLLLSGLVCFFILPRMSPYILGVMAIVMFGFGVWQHYSTFPYEYRISAYLDLLGAYSGFILTTIVIVVVGGFILNSHGVNPPSIAEIVPQNLELPSLTGSKSIFNLSGNSSFNPMASVTKAVNGTMNSINNTLRRNKPVLASTSFGTV